jgi:glucose/arabinose dehydrogenase
VQLDLIVISLEDVLAKAPCVMARLLLCAALAAFLQMQLVFAQTCSNTLQPRYGPPVVAGGWAYRVLANGFTRPRGILFDQNGALLVVDSRVGIIHLSLTDNGGTCLSVARKTTLISSPDVSGLV